MPSLNDTPDESTKDGMVLGTNRSRMALVSGTPMEPEDHFTFSESPATFSRYRQSAGIDNPYGSGLEAYEPNTVIFTDYQNAYSRVQDSKQDEEYQKALKEAHSATYNFGGVASMGTAGGIPNQPAEEVTGQIGQAIDYALDMAKRRVPYVWGGTSLNGADCSGMLYAVFNAAGIKVPRYRAVDWGKQGTEVPLAQARAGDVIYWDNPNSDTDHVGLYLGNGKVVQAPNTGDVVRVTSVHEAGNMHVRRVFDDKLFNQVAQPGGGSTWVYGATNRSWNNTAVTPLAAPGQYTSTIVRNGRTIGF